jgi:histone acetyltransferase (RNA polymerase elongator complex component)
LVPVGEKSLDDVQHKGVGKKLVKKAEWIAWLNGCIGTAIISGEGVKKYYEKQGYYECETYMVKSFINMRYIILIIIKYIKSISRIFI